MKTAEKSQKELESYFLSLFSRASPDPFETVSGYPKIQFVDQFVTWLIDECRTN